MSFNHKSSDQSVPVLKYKVHDTVEKKYDDQTGDRGKLDQKVDFYNESHSSANFEHIPEFTNDSKQGYIHDMPQLPDFTKRPKIMPFDSSGDYSVEGYLTDNHIEYSDLNYENSSNVEKHGKRPFYNVQGHDAHSRNASVTFFSDAVADERTYNELPLNEILDDFEFDDSASNVEVDIKEEEEEEEKEYDDQKRYPPSRTGTPDPRYEYINQENRSVSPFLRPPPPEYTTEIPAIYDSTKLNYPYKSPLDYSDEEFEKMNHFEFLRDLGFDEPPLLPVYLNSNLLNDSNNKNYKTFPYQYQESTVPHVNEIYRYRINDLNLMDKYSTHKPSRPVLKRSNSSNSSSSSNNAIKTYKTLKHNNTNKILNKNKLNRENSNNSTKSSSKLKHADKMMLIERNLIPHHVMLNHLITCNLNKEGYITSSCITRYKGKFITQIMYFSNELEKI